MFGNRNGGYREPLRNKLARWMSGRNGADELGRFLWWVWLSVFVLEVIAGSFDWQILYAVLSLLNTFDLVFYIFRIFSRNLYARRRENEWFLKRKRGVKGFFILQKSRIRDRKTHVYRTCPHCKNTLRLPRRKGEHTVNCPACHNRFSLRI